MAFEADRLKTHKISADETGNSTKTLLSAGQTFTGNWEDVTNYTTVAVAIKGANQTSGTLYIEASQDGGITVNSVPLNIADASFDLPHIWNVVETHIRIRYTNGAENQTGHFQIQTKYSNAQELGLLQAADNIITGNTEVQIVKSILTGKTDSGLYRNVPVSQEGHIEMEIHAPLLPFGSVHSEGLTPVLQFDSVYGVNPALVTNTVGHATGGASSASVSGIDNKLKCSTGTTALSFSTIQSIKRIRYRPGQGIIARFTAFFENPAANMILIAGIGTAEAGLYFGYNGTSFGILHYTRGIREIQTLTITTASTSANDYQITLAGISYTVSATNNGNTNRTAYEISRGNFGEWKAQSIGNTVVFLFGSAGDKTGTFSIAQAGAGTPVAGNFVETLAGATGSEVWIPQNTWNGDKLDGTGASGVVLKKDKGNVYQINVQYLGFGSISFFIETATSQNNSKFTRVHTIDYPNNNTLVNLSQPAMPFTMTAYSAGSTTDGSVSVGSVSGFIEGKTRLNGPNITYTRSTNNFVGSVADTYYPLFTVRNSLVHGFDSIKKANQSIVILKSLSCSHDDATPVTFVILKNAVLQGNINFQKYSTSSCTDWDTTATTATITSKEQIIFSLETGQATGETLLIGDEDNIVDLQPGETITVAAFATTGTATYVNASLNTREDQ